MFSNRELWNHAGSINLIKKGYFPAGSKVLYAHQHRRSKWLCLRVPERLSAIAGESVAVRGVWTGNNRLRAARLLLRPGRLEPSTQTMPSRRRHYGIAADPALQRHGVDILSLGPRTPPART